jgi:hypothetical protein
VRSWSHGCKSDATLDSFSMSFRLNDAHAGSEGSKSRVLTYRRVAQRSEIIAFYGKPEDPFRNSRA